MQKEHNGESINIPSSSAMELPLTVEFRSSVQAMGKDALLVSLTSSLERNRTTHHGLHDALLILLHYFSLPEMTKGSGNRNWYAMSSLLSLA